MIPVRVILCLCLWIHSLLGTTLVFSQRTIHLMQSLSDPDQLDKSCRYEAFPRRCESIGCIDFCLQPICSNLVDDRMHHVQYTVLAVLCTSRKLQC